MIGPSPAPTASSRGRTTHVTIQPGRALYSGDCGIGNRHAMYPGTGMTLVIRSVRHGIRHLAAGPVFSSSATLTLAIAVGAPASVYGVVDAVLFKAIPFRDPDHALVLWATNAAEHIPRSAVSAADFIDYRAQSTALASVAAVTGKPVTVYSQGEPERICAIEVTPNWFSTMGLSPELRRFLAADSVGPPEVVISYGYWQSRYAGSPAALGQTFRLDEQPYTRRR